MLWLLEEREQRDQLLLRESEGCADLQWRIIELQAAAVAVRQSNSLPHLYDMLKGFRSDQYYSGHKSEAKSSWLEFRGSDLAAQASKLGVLGNPVMAFIAAKECICRIREYTLSAEGKATGELDVPTVTTVKIIYICQASAVHPKYVHIKTISAAGLPTFSELEDSVSGQATAEGAAAEGAAAQGGFSTCHLKGHQAADWFLMNDEKREAFLNRRPEQRQKIMKRVEDYQKHGKLPGALACEDVVLTPGLVADPETAFAIHEVFLQDIEGASEFEDVLFSMFTPVGQVDTSGVLRLGATSSITTPLSAI
ncbi:hypothetical protein CYMTET_39853 [Cymbomonas tetramitiformis]|uniref:Uncharacterized protein n=1 Tax=Cymbomonas tetramitiformis TaxID=36881 RepID=A0AAE0C9A0_9CHLO|nr:hypothetical protein CYMTET_42540 [Cymbomonas tetramitiformis]KAK3250781.1 hypothetical protein CYMTET_39853 [Cymbomonas tetramitiformis]